MVLVRRDSFRDSTSCNPRCPQTISHEAKRSTRCVEWQELYKVSVHWQIEGKTAAKVLNLLEGQLGRTAYGITALPRYE